MRRLTLLLALALGGCADGPTLETIRTARVAPANYRAELLAYLRNFLNDPTNVRNAYVSEPALGRFQGEERYFSCVRFDARTSYGSYRGSRDHLAVYFGGKLEHFAELRPDAASERCRGANYLPFPELEQLKR
jgi:hypothetical protein